MLTWSLLTFFFSHRPAIDKHSKLTGVKKPSGGSAAEGKVQGHDTSEFIIREVRTAKVLAADADDDDFVPDL